MKKKSDKKLLMEAIRENCIMCMIDPEIDETRETASARVARCPMTICPLYQYRYGTTDSNVIADI